MDPELVVLGPDGRALDEFTAFRWGFLEIHGFGPEDDPGDGEGWLQALVEKVLGCPVEEDEWGAVALLAGFDSMCASLKAVKDEAREALEIHDHIDATDPGLPMAKRVTAAATKTGAKVSAGPDRSLMVTRSGRFANIVTFIDTSGPNLRPRVSVSRPREHSPRRQRVRSSSGASRDGPESDEPPLDRSSPARAGRLGVEAAA